MMTKIKNVCAVLLMMTLSLCALAQTPTPAIGLKATFYNTSVVELEWVTPPNVQKCVIKYETQYDSTITVIPNFALDSGQLVRASPIGTWEKFTIIFEDAFGNTYSDEETLTTHYGGLVIIEDEVFYLKVANECVANEYSQFYFVPYCLVGNVDVICQLSTQYHIENGYNSDLPPINLEGPNALDEEIYTEFMIGAMDGLLNNPNSGVENCSVLDGSGITRAEAKRVSTAPQELDYVCYPNPFESSINIRSEGQQAQDKEEAIRILDMTGRVVHTGVISGTDSKSISTEAWSPGIYVVMIGEGTRQQTMKVVKR
ncbi:MAG: T9SS type A sorting domain-containing protein [Bacteroidia bacterium]